MAQGITMEIRKVFNMAQDGVVASKLCTILEPIQRDYDENEFYNIFVNHLQKAMIFYKAEKTVERVMDFVSSFVTFATLVKQKEKKETESIDSTEDDVMEPFLAKILHFLVHNHNSREKAVRYRCCQLINKILNHMGEDAMIDEDLSDSIYECMLIRIKDKCPPIRIQAVLALVRLQDPEDEECPVIDAFLHSMRTDTNPDVRRTVLANIALSRKTLPYVLGRIRDIKDTNRKCAFVTLAEKVSIRAFTIAQRINLLTVGLKDRSPMVKQACGQMLKAWLRSHEHNVFKLLEALDTDGSVECSQLVLEHIFKEAGPEKLKEYIKLITDVSEDMNGPVKLIGYDKLTPEITFFWYMLCKHLKSMGNSGELLLQQLLPELTNFCEYIKLYAERNFIDSALITAFEGNESCSQEFILEHLLNIAGLLDFTDEVGRKNLKGLVYNLLVAETMPLSLASVLVDRYINAESDEGKYVKEIVETIADIKEPLVQVVTTAMKENSRRNELQLARITVAINECQVDLEGAIKSHDFRQAAILKDQLAEHEKKKEEILLEVNMNKVNEPQRVEKDDPETMLKCMTIASSMLYHVKKLGINSTLLTLKDELIFEGVKNEDPFIRNEAIKCLGHLSLLSKDFAAQHLVLFLQVAQVDQELLQITAVNIIFDLLLIYGFDAFNMEKNRAEKDKDAEMDVSSHDQSKDENEEGEERTVVEDTPPEDQKNAENAAEGVLSIMLMFLEGESADLRTSVAEGLAKLLINGRIVSAKILTRLILLWYNPITEDDTKLRHCLGVFLPLFAFESRGHQELIEETFIPVVKTLLNAPTSSPLSRVNVSNVMDLLIQLTDVRNLAQFNVTTDVSRNHVLNSMESHVHDSMAMRLANELISDPEDADVRLLCKALNQFDLCPRNVTTIQDLMELSNQLMELLEANRLAKKMIEKFKSNLERLMTEGGGSIASNDQEMQEADTNEDESDRASTISKITTTDNNTTLTTTVNEDADITLTNNDASPNEKKHKLSSSSERLSSVSKRKKLESNTGNNMTNNSVDFHLSINKPVEVESDQIEDDSDEEEEEE